MVHTSTEHSAPIASQRLGDAQLLNLALGEGCTVVAAHSATRAFFDPPAENFFPHLEVMMRANRVSTGTRQCWGCSPAGGACPIS